MSSKGEVFGFLLLRDLLEGFRQGRNFDDDRQFFKFLWMFLEGVD